MTLIEYAKRELEIAGVGGPDNYGDLLPQAVLELIEVFSKQGHSGSSAGMVIQLFSDLASYKNLTPLTDNPDEWHHYAEDIAGVEGGFWHNIRNGEAFSHDGGKTYYLLSECGNDKHREPLHTSDPHKKEN